MMVLKSINIDKAAYKDMITASSLAYPGECCGCMLGEECGPLVCQTRPSVNSLLPEGSMAHYLVDPMELLRMESTAADMGLEIKGFYHSHPDCGAILSKEDAKNMVPGMVYVIISQTKEGVRDVRAYFKDPSALEISEAAIILRSWE